MAQPVAMFGGRGPGGPGSGVPRPHIPPHRKAPVQGMLRLSPITQNEDPMRQLDVHISENGTLRMELQDGQPIVVRSSGTSASPRVPDPPSQQQQHQQHQQQPQQETPELLGKIQWNLLQLGHQIGKGSQAKVRKVKYQNSFYALKVITLDSKTTKNQLQQELSHVLRAKHPNIVASTDAFYVDGSLKILMELMDVGTLSEILAKINFIDEEKILPCIAYQILNGLVFLHKADILHRDIKPSNILVNSMGLVKLSDFGISKVINKNSAVTITGTTAYMSPERMRGESFPSVDDVFKTDIWSVGLTIVRCALGVFPFCLNLMKEEAELAEDVDPFTVPINFFNLSTLLEDNKATIDFDELVPKIRSLYSDRRHLNPSPELRDFVLRSTSLDVTKRPTATELQNHEFVKRCCRKANIKSWLLAMNLMPARSTAATTTTATTTTATTSSSGVSAGQSDSTVSP
eukprot:RCo020456